MDLGLEGRKALITGGSSGIGFAIAKRLVQEGTSVGILARDSARLNQAVTKLKEHGNALGVAADVTVPEQVQNGVKKVAEQLGGLNIVVANVGGHVGEKWLVDSTTADWANTLQLNVLHSVDTVRAAIPFMKGKSGSVLLISSITGWRPGPSSAYATAKAALIHLAASLAQELGPYDIRVNALSPGSVGDSEGWQDYAKNNPSEFAKFLKEEFPQKRLVTLEQVANTACFVLSPIGAGINGANVTVDAGQYRPHAIRFPDQV